MNLKVSLTGFAGLVAVFATEADFAQTSLIVGNVPGYPDATVSVPVTLRQGGSAVKVLADGQRRSTARVSVCAQGGCRHLLTGHGRIV